LSTSSDISQGSVATHLKIGGIYSNSSITNCLQILTVKKIENRLISLYDEIIKCTKMVPKNFKHIFNFVKVINRNSVSFFQLGYSKNDFLMTS